MSFLYFSQRVVTFFLTTFCLSVCIAMPALAHHVGDNVPFSSLSSSSLIQGLLSGFAHPFLDPPHGVLIIATALLASQMTRLTTLPIILALSTWLGATFFTFVLPVISLQDAPFLVAIGIVALIGVSITCIVRPSSMTSYPLMALCVFILGLSHSGLYAMEWIGNETTPILAYLSGLVLLHYVITSGLAWLIFFALSRKDEDSPRRREVIPFYRVAFGVVICGAVLSTFSL